jgi:hypothetical protein
MKVGVPLPTYQDVEQKLLPHIAASKQLLETLSNSFTLPSLQNGTALRDVQVNPEVQKAHAAYVKTSADGVKINTDMTGIHKQYIQDTIAYMRYTNNLRDTKVADAKKIADQFSTTVQVRLEQADQRLQATRASIEATRANNIKLGQEILMNAVTSIHNLMASWMKQNPPAPFNTTDVEEFLKINGSDLPTKRLQDAHYQISSDVKSHLIIGQIKDFSVFRNPSASNGDA